MQVSCIRGHTSVSYRGHAKLDVRDRRGETQKHEPGKGDDTASSRADNYSKSSPGALKTTRYCTCMLRTSIVFVSDGAMII